MNLLKFHNPEELAEHGSNLIIRKIREKPDMLICTASGNSTTKIYDKVGDKKSSFNSRLLRILKLDEWGGILPESSGTCETYLKKHVLQPWDISDANFISFRSNPENPQAEVERVQMYVEEKGPVDLCILGLGLNGHIAFNEPHAFLQPKCHLSVLSEASKNHPMFTEAGQKPTYGLTLGMANILQSKKILLVILGKNKQEVIARFLKGEITTSLPASFLWLHPKVECLLLEE